MFQRTLRLLLLASVAFWAIGAATYLHERLEHSGISVASAWGAEHGSGESSRPHRSPQHPGQDDHDDCPTCQLLAHMSVDGVVPPTAVPSATLVAPETPLGDWRSPHVSLPASGPIRGPPCMI